MQSLLLLLKKEHVRKKVLDIGYDYDFLLAAIVSPVKDYMICWHLNRQLGFDLVRQQDLEINFLNRKKLGYFSCFEYKDLANHVSFVLLSNKSGGEWLIPELEKVDYFLMLRDNIEAVALKPIIESIKGIAVVQTVFEVDHHDLRSKQNLIF